MKRIHTALLLNLLTVASATAASITIQHSYEFPDEDPSPKTWTLPKFDTSLGTLTSVEYFAGGTMWSDYTFTGINGAGGFSVGVGGFFFMSAPGLTAYVNIPTKTTGKIFVGTGGSVAGRVDSSGDASGTLYTPAAFLPGSSDRNLTLSMYQPENYGYGTTLLPDVCWHGEVGFVVIYHFDGDTDTPTPEPATWLTMLGAVAAGAAAIKSRAASIKCTE